jgi:hypothetical protein
VKLLIGILLVLVTTTVNRDPVVRDPGEQKPPGVCQYCVIVKWVTD